MPPRRNAEKAPKAAGESRAGATNARGSHHTSPAAAPLTFQALQALYQPKNAPTAGGGGGGAAPRGTGKSDSPEENLSSPAPTSVVLASPPLLAQERELAQQRLHAILPSTDSSNLFSMDVTGANVAVTAAVITAAAAAAAGEKTAPSHAKPLLPSDMGLLRPTGKRGGTGVGLPSGAHIKRRPPSVPRRFVGGQAATRGGGSAATGAGGGGARATAGEAGGRGGTAGAGAGHDGGAGGVNVYGSPSAAALAGMDFASPPTLSLGPQASVELSHSPLLPGGGGGRVGGPTGAHALATPPAPAGVGGGRPGEAGRAGRESRPLVFDRRADPSPAPSRPPRGNRRRTHPQPSGAPSLPLAMSGAGGGLAAGHYGRQSSDTVVVETPHREESAAHVGVGGRLPPTMATTKRLPSGRSGVHAGSTSTAAATLKGREEAVHTYLMLCEELGETPDRDWVSVLGRTGKDTAETALLAEEGSPLGTPHHAVSHGGSAGFSGERGQGVTASPSAAAVAGGNRSSSGRRPRVSAAAVDAVPLTATGAGVGAGGHAGVRRAKSPGTGRASRTATGPAGKRSASVGRVTSLNRPNISLSASSSPSAGAAMGAGRTFSGKTPRTMADIYLERMTTYCDQRLRPYHARMELLRQRRDDVASALDSFLRQCDGLARAQGAVTDAAAPAPAPAAVTASLDTQTADAMRSAAGKQGSTPAVPTFSPRSVADLHRAAESLTVGLHELQSTVAELLLRLGEYASDARRPLLGSRGGCPSPTPGPSTGGYPGASPAASSPTTDGAALAAVCLTLPPSVAAAAGAVSEGSGSGATAAAPTTCPPSIPPLGIQDIVRGRHRGLSSLPATPTVESAPAGFVIFVQQQEREVAAQLRGVRERVRAALEHVPLVHVADAVILETPLFLPATAGAETGSGREGAPTPTGAGGQRSARVSSTKAVVGGTATATATTPRQTTGGPRTPRATSSAGSPRSKRSTTSAAVAPPPVAYLTASAPVFAAVDGRARAGQAVGVAEGGEEWTPPAADTAGVGHGGSPRPLLVLGSGAALATALAGAPWVANGSGDGGTPAAGAGQGLRVQQPQRSARAGADGSALVKGSGKLSGGPVRSASAGVGKRGGGAGVGGSATPRGGTAVSSLNNSMSSGILGGSVRSSAGLTSGAVSGAKRPTAAAAAAGRKGSAAAVTAGSASADAPSPITDARLAKARQIWLAVSARAPLTGRPVEPPPSKEQQQQQQQQQRRSDSPLHPLGLRGGSEEFASMGVEDGESLGCVAATVTAQPSEDIPTPTPPATNTSVTTAFHALEGDVSAHTLEDDLAAPLHDGQHSPGTTGGHVPAEVEQTAKPASARGALTPDREAVPRAPPVEPATEPAKQDGRPATAPSTEDVTAAGGKSTVADPARRLALEDDGLVAAAQPPLGRSGRVDEVVARLAERWRAYVARARVRREQAAAAACAAEAAVRRVCEGRVRRFLCLVVRRRRLRAALAVMRARAVAQTVGGSGGRNAAAGSAPSTLAGAKALEKAMKGKKAAGAAKSPVPAAPSARASMEACMAAELAAREQRRREFIKLLTDGCTMADVPELPSLPESTAATRAGASTSGTGAPRARAASSRDRFEQVKEQRKAMKSGGGGATATSETARRTASPTPHPPLAPTTGLSISSAATPPPAPPPQQQHQQQQRQQPPTPPLPLLAHGISTKAIAAYNSDAENFEVSVLHRLLRAPQPLLYALRVATDRYPTLPPMGYARARAEDGAEAGAKAGEKGKKPPPTASMSPEREASPSVPRAEHTRPAPQPARAARRRGAEEQAGIYTLPFARLRRYVLYHAEVARVGGDTGEFTRPPASPTEPEAGSLGSNSASDWLPSRAGVKVNGANGGRGGLSGRVEGTRQRTVPLSVRYTSVIDANELGREQPVAKSFPRPFERWGLAHSFSRRVFAAAAMYAWKLLFSHTPHDDFKQRQLRTEAERQARLDRVHQRNRMVLACYCVRSEREWLREASKDLSFVGQLWNPKKSMDPNDPDLDKHCRETYAFVEDFVFQCFPTANALDEVPSFLVGAGIYFTLKEVFHACSAEEMGTSATEARRFAAKYPEMIVSAVDAGVDDDSAQERTPGARPWQGNGNSNGNGRPHASRTGQGGGRLSVYQQRTVQAYELVDLIDRICQWYHLAAKQAAATKDTANAGGCTPTNRHDVRDTAHGGEDDPAVMDEHYRLQASVETLAAAWASAGDCVTRSAAAHATPTAPARRAHGSPAMSPVGNGVTNHADRAASGAFAASAFAPTAGSGGGGLRDLAHAGHTSCTPRAPTGVKADGEAAHPQQGRGALTGEQQGRKAEWAMSRVKLAKVPQSALQAFAPNYRTAPFIKDRETEVLAALASWARGEEKRFDRSCRELAVLYPRGFLITLSEALAFQLLGLRLDLEVCEDLDCVE